jgi:hypothetical protein
MDNLLSIKDLFDKYKDNPPYFKRSIDKLAEKIDVNDIIFGLNFIHDYNKCNCRNLQRSRGECLINSMYTYVNNTTRYYQILSWSLKKTSLYSARLAILNQIHHYSKFQILMLGYSLGVITRDDFKQYLTLEIIINNIIGKGTSTIVFKNLYDHEIITLKIPKLLKIIGGVNEEFFLDITCHIVNSTQKFDIKQLYSIAARFGYLSVIKKLYTQFELDSEITYYAAKHNHLNILKWAQDNYCPWSSRFNHISYSRKLNKNMSNGVRNWVNTKSIIRYLCGYGF